MIKANLSQVPALKSLIASNAPQASVQSIALLLGLSSIAALSYNLVHARLIHQTSAVTTTVIGQIKVIGLVACAAFLLGEPITAFSDFLHCPVCPHLWGGFALGHDCLALFAGEKEAFNAQMTVGTGIALLGFMFYSFLKLKKTQAADSSKASDEERGLNAKLLLGQQGDSPDRLQKP